jgi:alpha-tubulin suppressor-like RCC1 family protein
MRYGLLVAALTSSVAAIAGCKSGDTGSTGPGGPSGNAANIVKVSGDNQSGVFGSAIPAPLVVEVTDSAGQPVTDASVAWAIYVTGAPEKLQVSSTNTSGQTQLSPFLGGRPGAFSVVAAINTKTVTFTGTSNVGLGAGLKNFTTNLFAKCALSSQGGALCWGNGLFGQLGPGITGPVTGPAPIPGGHTFTQISGGGNLDCGLAAGGVMYCWGNAQYPQLGNGPPSTGTNTTPVAAGNGRTFSSITVGTTQACGISAGVAYCWGYGRQGQLGTGDTVTRFVPTAVQVPAGVSFTTLAAGGLFTCGLTAAGAAYCWGQNASGELGSGSSSPANALSPNLVTGGHTFSALAVSLAAVCGLASGGTVYCWGHGANGNGTSAIEYSPTAITQGSLTFTQLSATGGLGAICALTSGGAAYCWGDNQFGEVGNGVFGNSVGGTPVAVTGGHVFSAIVPGPLTTCGYSTNQVMYCWGANQSGELGLAPGADTIYAVPQPVPGLSTP